MEATRFLKGTQQTVYDRYFPDQQTGYSRETFNIKPRKIRGLLFDSRGPSGLIYLSPSGIIIIFDR